MHEPSLVAQIIEDYRKASGVSVRSAAKQAGLSEGRWRQIAKGYQQATKDVRVPVNAPIETLGRMALGLRMDPSAFNAPSYANGDEAELAQEVQDWVEKNRPKVVTSPVFGGSYGDPGYMANLEGWLLELQERVESVERRMEVCESDDPDYSGMSAADATNKFDLAAKGKEHNIGGSDLPSGTD